MSGTLYDHSAAPTVYCLVGACTDNWSPAAAVEFADVNGVLTANVPDLNGGFKIIKNHEWGYEAGAPAGAALNFNQDFVLTTTGAGNIAFANPFAGYKNAVVTLDVTNEEAPVLKVVGGTFSAPDFDWYLAGAATGWECTDKQKMKKIDDTHYEFVKAEFYGDFKIVFGNWAVEYGWAKNDSTSKWEINKSYDLATPCANVTPASDTKYEDVMITITVDYENATVKVALESDKYTAVENLNTEVATEKRIENGQVVLIKNGVRYNVLGTVLR